MNPLDLLYIVLILVSLLGMGLTTYHLGRKHGLESQQSVVKLLQEQLSKQEQQYKEQMAQQEQQFKAQQAQYRADAQLQMKAISADILAAQTKQLHEANLGQMNSIIDPLKQAINQWKQTVAQNEQNAQERITRLDAAIRTTLDRTEQVGARADRLANALTGENKTTGNFGELKLRSLLEEMGLEEPTQFEEQGTLRDAQGRTLTSDEGHRLIPDVLLHFPDHRDVIIDSKMSITAYERYCNATTDAERDQALKDHVASVRAHVDELARKDYSKYLKADNTKLDFVVMYLPIEASLQAALMADATLWHYAYKRGVFITSSRNMYALLRVLEVSWKHMLQVQNQAEIIKYANLIVERTQDFYGRLQALEDQFQGVSRAFNQLRITTASQGPSIVTAARKLVKLGASENKKKPSLDQVPTNQQDNTLNNPTNTSES